MGCGGLSANILSYHTNSCHKLHVHALAMHYRSTINIERKVAFDKTASDKDFALKGTWE